MAANREHFLWEAYQNFVDSTRECIILRDDETNRERESAGKSRRVERGGIRGRFDGRGGGRLRNLSTQPQEIESL